MINYYVVVFFTCTLLILFIGSSLLLFFPKAEILWIDDTLAASATPHSTPHLQWIESESGEPVVVTCIHHVWKPFLKIYLEQWSHDRYTPKECYKYKTYL